MVTNNLGRKLIISQSNSSDVIVDSLSDYFNIVTIDGLNELVLETTDYNSAPRVVTDSVTVATTYPTITDSTSNTLRLQTLRFEYDGYTEATKENEELVDHINNTLVNYARLYALRSILSDTVVANYLNVSAVSGLDAYNTNYPSNLQRTNSLKFNTSLYDRARSGFAIGNQLFDIRDMFLIGMPYRLAESYFYTTLRSYTSDLQDRFLHVSKPVFVSTSATAITNSPTLAQDSDAPDGLVLLPRLSRNIYIGISEPIIRRVEIYYMAK